ncbi:PAS domain S-box protein, partial [Acinetobacter baumannii]
GQSIDLVVPEDRRAEARGIINRISSNESIAQHETVRIGKDGRRIDVVLNVSPLRADNGEIIGASKIAHDITEEKQSREKLRREIEER